MEYNSIVKCPGDSTCSNQGTCDVSNGTCVCDSGFQGDMCQGKIFLELTNAPMYEEIIYINIYRNKMFWSW